MALTIKQLNQQLNQLALKGFPQASESALRRMGLLTQREAVKRAPISPTKFQYVNFQLTRDSDTERDDFNPGNLRRSIRILELNPQFVELGVASNSLAGQYADKMHEDEYNLGVGSEAAAAKDGIQVGRKFLDRGLSVIEKSGKMERILEDEIEKSLRRGKF